jgi:hypothetical protein
MSAKIKIEIDETTLRQLVINHLCGILNAEINPNEVSIEVKSKQNYKSEWEDAAFRAVISKSV